MRIIISILLAFIQFHLFSQNKEDRKVIKQIEKSEIESFTLKIDSSYKSNQPIDFRIVMTTEKGKEIISTGYINFHCFEIVGNNAKINKEGQLVLNLNEIGLEKSVNVKFRNKGDKSITKEFSIALNYKGLLNLDYSGKNGLDGINGQKGVKSTKNEISTSGIGGDGQSGFSGEDGHNVVTTVEVKNCEELNKEILFIRIRDSTNQSVSHYYADLNDSKIVVNISGGNGGQGGNGGKGAKGELKHISELDIILDAYDGEYGGNGGDGGDGGRCGKLHLVFDAVSVRYKSHFEVVAFGGIGGRHGKSGERGEIGDLLYRGKVISPNHVVSRLSREGIEQAGRDGLEGQCQNILKIITRDRIDY